MREADIQSDIIGYLRGVGAYVYNAGGSASAAKGTSDLLVCYKGAFLAIELKKPDGSYGATTPQLIRQRQVRKAGGYAFVATSIADVAAALASVEESEPNG